MSLKEQVESLASFDAMLDEFYPKDENGVNQIPKGPAIYWSNVTKKARSPFEGVSREDAMAHPVCFVQPAQGVTLEEEMRIRSYVNIVTPPMYGTFLLDPDPPRPIDPLDGETLRCMLARDEAKRREDLLGATFTPQQRAAISAYWSAQLRAKVAASAKHEQNQVMMPLDVEDCEW